MNGRQIHRLLARMCAGPGDGRSFPPHSEGQSHVRLDNRQASLILTTFGASSELDAPPRMRSWWPPGRVSGLVGNPILSEISPQSEQVLSHVLRPSSDRQQGLTRDYVYVTSGVCLPLQEEKRRLENTTAPEPIEPEVRPQSKRHRRCSRNPLQRSSGPNVYYARPRNSATARTRSRRPTPQRAKIRLFLPSTPGNLNTSNLTNLNRGLACRRHRALVKPTSLCGAVRMGSTSVLVVEDNPLCRATAIDILEDLGFTAFAPVRPSCPSFT